MRCARPNDPSKWDPFWRLVTSLEMCLVFPWPTQPHHPGSHRLAQGNLKCTRLKAKAWGVGNTNSASARPHMTHVKVPIRWKSRFSKEIIPRSRTRKPHTDETQEKAWSTAREALKSLHSITDKGAGCENSETSIQIWIEYWNALY